MMIDLDNDKPFKTKMMYRANMTVMMFIQKLSNTIASTRLLIKCRTVKFG